MYCYLHATHWSKIEFILYVASDLKPLASILGYVALGLVN